MFKQQYGMYLITLGASLAISVGLQLLLPFPFGFIAALGFFLVFPFVFGKKLQQKINGATKTIKFRCMACARIHNNYECPKCGSRMKKADYG